MKAALVFCWLNNKLDWHPTTAADLAAHLGVSTTAAQRLLMRLPVPSLLRREIEKMLGDVE